MKTLRLLPLILAMAVAANAADLASPSARTVVVFDHPENFTDVKDSNNPTDRGRNAILDELRNHLASRATPLLRAGETLTVTFTDIDLAGEFEPQRGPGWDDVRIVKDIYPPDLKFTYAVTDMAGAVVKQGSENIRDMNFQTRLVMDINDPLRYEKDILNDWARSTLKDLKAP
jgi:hypothetical protein